MPTYTKFKVGDELTTNNNGTFTIIEDLGTHMTQGSYYRWFKIRFNLTGYTKAVPSSSLCRGQIYDPYYPRKFGVACIGEVKNKDAKYDKLYSIWNAIINRCYNPNDKEYNIYGGAGVRVSNNWLCFENFYREVKQLSGYNLWYNDSSNYQLDKDVLQSHLPKSQRVYSKETCMFINRRQNIQQQTADRGIKSGLYGVEKHGKRYRTIVHDGGKTFIIGSFQTAEEAGACYNDYISINHPYMKMNNVPYMTHDEIRAADLSKHVLCKIIEKDSTLKEMCKIVDKQQKKSGY